MRRLGEGVLDGEQKRNRVTNTALQGDLNSDRIDGLTGRISMATPDQIPTDLTLEIGEAVAPERFIAAARAFFGYVEEVSKSLVDQGDGAAWVVHVREGSTLIGVGPAPASPPPSAAVYRAVQRGVEELGAGRLDGSDLSEAALRHLRTLSEFTDGSHGKPVPIHVWVQKKPVAVNPEIAHVIREDQKVSYEAYGTVEGRLRAIQDRGSVTLQIRDDLLGLTLDCYVSEDQLPEAFSNFRKRVEVSGLIHYRRNGLPASIEAHRILPLPEDTDLPSADEVRGLLRIVG